MKKSKKNYKKNLLLKFAEENLNEDPDTKRECLEEMKKWVLSQRHLKNIRTDPEFLLRFLRFQKFKLQEAKAVLDKYVHMRTQHKEWFHDLDVHDPKLKSLILSGCIFVLPNRDKHGRRVVFVKPTNGDPSQFTGLELMKAHLLLYETLLCDEENQIRGLSYVFDERNIGWNHVSVFSPTEISKAMKCCEKALPIRHLEMHCVGMPWTLNLVLKFLKSLMSQKLRDRIFSYPDFESEGVPLELLPNEYNPENEQTTQEMAESWLAEMVTKREEVLALEKMSYVQNNSRKVESVNSTKRSDSDGVLDVIISVENLHSNEEKSH